MQGLLKYRGSSDKADTININNIQLSLIGRNNIPRVRVYRYHVRIDYNYLDRGRERREKL